MGRRELYYKAAQTSLQGPYFNNPGGIYLPGTEHTSPLHVASMFGEGIHYTAHQRVAARWGPVVLQVRVLGEQYTIPERVAPRYRKDVPRDILMGKYNKYRTDRIRVGQIVGIAAYGHGQKGSFEKARDLLAQLNITLARHGRKPMALTGESLEVLRTPFFQLWGVMERDPIIERYTITVDVNVYNDIAPVDVRGELERAIEQGVGTLSFVQTVGAAHAEPAKREPIGG